MASALPRKTAALYMLESSSELAVKQAEDCFQLNLEEAGLVSGGGFQVYSTEDYRVSVDMANGYRVYEALRPLPQSRQRSITDEEAKALAAFVEENGLWDGESYDIALSHSTTGGWTGPEAVTSTSVWFYPAINGLPVVGIFRICVTLDMAGNIVSVYKQVNDILESRQVPVLEAAELDLRLTEGDYAAQASTTLTDAALTDCMLSYYGDGYSVNGKTYLYPVALLRGSGTAPDGTAESFSILFGLIA